MCSFDHFEGSKKKNPGVVEPDETPDTFEKMETVRYDDDDTGRSKKKPKIYDKKKGKIIKIWKQKRRPFVGTAHTRAHHLESVCVVRTRERERERECGRR